MKLWIERTMTNIWRSQVEDRIRRLCSPFKLPSRRRWCHKVSISIRVINKNRRRADRLSSPRCAEVLAYSTHLMRVLPISISRPRPSNSPRQVRNAREREGTPKYATKERRNGRQISRSGSLRTLLELRVLALVAVLEGWSGFSLLEMTLNTRTAMLMERPAPSSIKVIDEVVRCKPRHDRFYHLRSSTNWNLQHYHSRLETYGPWVILIA